MARSCASIASASASSSPSSSAAAVPAAAAGEAAAAPPPVPLRAASSHSTFRATASGLGSLAATFLAGEPAAASSPSEGSLMRPLSSCACSSLCSVLRGRAGNGGAAQARLLDGGWRRTAERGRLAGPPLGPAPHRSSLRMRSPMAALTVALRKSERPPPGLPLRLADDMAWRGAGGAVEVLGVSQVSLRMARGRRGAECGRKSRLQASQLSGGWVEGRRPGMGKKGSPCARPWPKLRSSVASALLQSPSCRHSSHTPAHEPIRQSARLSTMSAPPLALTSNAHAEQKGWRRGQHLVDSLPYVDALAPAEKAAVDKLIEEEVRRSTCRASCTRRGALPGPPPPPARRRSSAGPLIAAGADARFGHRVPLHHPQLALHRRPVLRLCVVRACLRIVRSACSAGSPRRYALRGLHVASAAAVLRRPACFHEVRHVSSPTAPAAPAAHAAPAVQVHRVIYPLCSELHQAAGGAWQRRRRHHLRRPPRAPAQRCSLNAALLCCSCVPAAAPLV